MTDGAEVVGLILKRECDLEVIERSDARGPAQRAQVIVFKKALIGAAVHHQESCRKKDKQGQTCSSGH
jgi:hypothetical protein